MTPPSVAFDVRMDTGERAELRLTGWLGWEIDDRPGTTGQVSLSTSGPLNDGDEFENIVDVSSSEARAIAAALIALADYLDRNENTKAPA